MPRSPKCWMCGVKVDKKLDKWCSITRVSAAGKEYNKTYFCDGICNMDHLNRYYRLDEKAFIETWDGKKWDLRGFWDFFRTNL